MKNIVTILSFCLLYSTMGYAQDTWTDPGPTAHPQASFNNAMATLGDDKILEFDFYGVTWVYDLSDNTWISMNPTVSPTGRIYHVMANIGGDKVILFGGTSDFDNYIPNNETWVYDLSDNVWTLLSPSTNPSARLSTAMAFAGGDHAVLYGGSPGGGETWMYDLSANTWTLKNSPSTPGSQTSHAMASLDEDRVLLFSGVVAGTNLTWVYDLSDNTWTEMTPIGQPSARFLSSMASLGGDRVLLYGGSAITVGTLADSWIYDYGDNAWTMMNPSFSPGGREGHAMASITTEHVLLFGGSYPDESTFLYTATPEPCPVEICNGIDDDCDGLIDEGVQILFYADTDNDGYGNPLVSLYTCEQPSGYIGTGTDCNDGNDLIYPDAVELADGIDNDCDGLIDEGVSVMDVDAGDCEVVYRGYFPAQCHTLTVNVMGGTAPYTYMWSNGVTTPSNTVCPTTTTIYSVTVTDHNGSTAKDKVTVQVIDIRCGNNNDKVIVCHVPPGNPTNMQTICVASSAVPAHLEHGDYLGACDATDPCETEEQPQAGINTHSIPSTENHIDMHVSEYLNTSDDGVLAIYPNPANTFLELELPGVEKLYEINLYDISGKLLVNQSFESGIQKLSTIELDNGIYIIQIKSSSEKMSTAIVVMH